MELETKVDLILSKVSNMETKMALIEERDKTLNEKVEIHEDRHQKAEAFQNKISIERSNIITVFKVVVWVVGGLTAGTYLTIMIVSFFSK